MAPSDFNLCEISNSRKSRYTSFSVHLHHSRNGPVDVACLKGVCLAGLGNTWEFTGASDKDCKLQSFQPAPDLKLKFLV